MKNSTSVRDYLTELTEISATDDASDDYEPQQISSISEYRLAHLFARNRVEQERLVVAFRRALTGQHLTLEYRIILTDQLLKVLHAARTSEAKLVHLRILLGEQTPKSEQLPAVHEALSPQSSSSLLRLSKILNPENANMLRMALQMLEQGKRLDIRRVRMIVEAFNTLLAVFETHPEMINLLRSKQRDVAPREEPTAATDAPYQPATQ